MGSQKRGLKDWSFLEWIGALAAIVGIIGGSYAGVSYFYEKVKDKKESFVILDEKVHLGDNTMAAFGGDRVPTLPAPGREEGAMVLFYDKAKSTFRSEFGFPSEVQAIAQYYGPIYAETNLLAYQHIQAISPTGSFVSSYKGASIQIDTSTLLIWNEHNGNFYYEVAAVAVTHTVNLYAALREKGYQPESIKLKGATLWLHGMHSGRRPDQPENVEVVVNGVRHPIVYRRTGLRREELISVKLETDALSVKHPNPTHFTIIVLPFQERYPLPPPGSSYEQRGPGHFRDIEIWKAELELTID